MAITQPRPDQADGAQPALPLLRDGDQMDQRSFHARYEQTPPKFRADLIGGVVYVMPSPISLDHGWRQNRIHGWLYDFLAGTPAVNVCADATVIFDDLNEMQPDACLFRRTAFGGAVKREGIYLAGVPDLVIEVALSSTPQDLGAKKTAYEQAGVPEYLVVLAQKHQVVWFAREEGRYVPLTPDGDGILRSRVFPGLWLDANALLYDDVARLKAVTQQGLESGEHRAWQGAQAENGR